MPPDLTYFIGRPFVEVEDLGEGSWAIVLDGNGQIINKDPKIAMPDDNALAGTVFVRPIFSELDTRLQFGVLDNVAFELTLNPTQYTISDPSFSQDAEGEHYPQVPVEIEDSLPPDPSPDRVWDGPEEQPEQPEDEEEG